MSFLSLLRHAVSPARGGQPAPFTERRSEARQAVFQEVILALGDDHKIRAIISDLSSRGAGIRYSARVDLPFRIRLGAPILKLTCWARVVWQSDGAAGVEFLPDENDSAHR